MKYILITFLIFVCLCLSATEDQQDLYQNYYDSLIYESSRNKQLEYAFKLLRIANELKNDSLRANAHFEISHAYRQLSNYSSSLTYILKAAQYYLSENDNLALSTTYHNIGVIYYTLGNFKLSVEYLNKALKIHLNNKMFVHAGDDYNNIGEAHRLAQNFDSAFYYFKNAYILYKNANDKSRIAYSQCNIGLIYLYNNQEAKADSLFNLSFNYLKSINDYYPECITYYEIASKAYSDQDFRKSNQYSKAAENLAKKYGFKKELTDILLLSSKINKDLGNYEKAFNDLSLYQAYSDSLINDKTVSQMAEMRAEFEISQNEAELTYLKKLSTARTRLLFVALVGIFIISLLALYAVRQSRKRKEANIQLSEANEELTQKNEVISQQSRDKDVLMKEIHHRVKNNLQIISSIMNLQSMRIENKQTLEIFEEMQRRIMAISGIHQKLYQSESVSVINVKDYLSEIVEAIHGAFNNNELNVNYQIAVENIELSVDVAVALGLMVNELTTNAYKYAFTPEKDNNLILTLNKTENRHLLISLQDNGPGVPDDFDFVNANSLGLRMVNLLARQQRGTINIDNKSGTRFEIDFEGPF